MTFKMPWSLKYLFITCALVSLCVPEVFSLYRVSRQAGDATKNELYFECKEDTQAVAERFRSLPITATTTVRRVDPKNVITTDTNPILNYTTFETKPYEANRGDKLFLLMSINALVTSYTLDPEKVSFHSENGSNLLKHSNVGADHNGGLDDSMNVFTQCWDLKQDEKSYMARFAADIDKFVRGHNDRYVEYTTVYSYATDHNDKLMHIPEFIQLRVRAYSKGNLVDLRGYPLQNYDSETENICLQIDQNNSSCDVLPKKD